jgi:hypothetical protein
MRPFVLEVTASLLRRVMASPVSAGGKYVQSRLKLRPLLGRDTVKPGPGSREDPYAQADAEHISTFPLEACGQAEAPAL